MLGLPTGPFISIGDPYKPRVFETSKSGLVRPTKSDPSRFVTKEVCLFFHFC